MEAQKPEHTTGGEERRSIGLPVFVCTRPHLHRRPSQCVSPRQARHRWWLIITRPRDAVSGVCVCRSCTGLHPLFHKEHVNQIIQLPRPLQMSHWAHWKLLIIPPGSIMCTIILFPSLCGGRCSQPSRLIRPHKRSRGYSGGPHGASGLISTSLVFPRPTTPNPLLLSQCL